VVVLISASTVCNEVNWKNKRNLKLIANFMETQLNETQAVTYRRSNVEIDYTKMYYENGNFNIVRMWNV
jgi:hypothetical protein